MISKTIDLIDNILTEDNIHLTVNQRQSIFEILSEFSEQKFKEGIAEGIKIMKKL